MVERARTLRELAEHAGVSAATVSRALHNNRRISLATRLRIQALAKRLGYRPDPRARSLRGGRIEAIGMIIGRCRQPLMTLGGFYGPTINAVSAKVEAAGYNLVLLTDRAAGDTNAMLPNMIEERHVAGVIVAEGLDDGLRREFTDYSFPYVLVDTDEREPLNCVYPRDDEAGILAVRHLAELGHRDIAYVNAGMAQHICVMTRLGGYLSGMSELGLTPRPGYEVRPVVERLTDLFRQRPAPTALMCFDDEVAVAAAHFLWQRRVRVPDEVSLVGINDIPLAARVVPRLTTVSTHAGPMGVAACTMLLERIETSSDVASQVLEPELVVRESTAPVKKRATRNSAKRKAK